MSAAERASEASSAERSEFVSGASEWPSALRVDFLVILTIAIVRGSVVERLVNVNVLLNQFAPL